MKLLHTIEETREEVAQARREGKIIGFVPTMGALHEGHLTLVEHAREVCGFVVVSIFVNPTQFGLSEDLDDYPRTLESDAHKCEQAGVDLIFAPSPAEMYPRGFDTWVEVNGPTEMLEGALRSEHFRGVTTVCAKLFNITNPDFAFFGKKDYQQLTVIRKMVRDLNMPLTVVPVDTVRERDGLAKSSRNVYLSSAERNAALALSCALRDVKEVFDSGECRVLTLKRIAENMIAAESMPRIDYVEIVDAETLTPIDEIIKPAVLLLAVKIGSTRLIDNIELWREI
jgi:pantoate--beta-alanine ligase